MTVRVYSSISIDTTLAAGGVSATATTMTVASGTGNSLMGGITLVAGDIFTIAIDPDTVNEEICYITAQSGDTFTITRHEAGTSGVVHAAGATVRHVLSSDDLTYFREGVQTADAAVAKSTLTTKGDILGRTSSAPARIPVGTDGYVLTADSTATLGVGWAAAPVTTLNITLNAQTGTTYTIALSDVNKLVTLDNASAITLTVPANATTAFPVGSQVNIQQIGAGQVTVSNAVGVTINGTGTKTRAQWSAATLLKTDTNVWTLIGDIV